MEENTGSETAAPRSKEGRPEVIIVRNWKEYLGESILIIFSVALAIILTEVFSKMHEERQTHEVLQQLRQELISNRESEEVQYAYHVKVMKNIDSALRDENYRKKVIDSGIVHLSAIAPDGVMKKDLNDVAWQVAKQENIFSRIDLATFSMLVDIYDNQQRVTKTEEEVGKVLLSFDSRKPENARMALKLVSDNYFGWSVERGPSLLKKYEKAIEALNKY